MERPEHIEDSATGPICRHCGGKVGADGFSEGGLVGPDSGEFRSPYVEDREAEQREPEEDMHTEQQDYTELLRERAHRQPPRPEKLSEPPSVHEDGEEESELAQRRRKHYAGILGGR